MTTKTTAELIDFVQEFLDHRKKDLDVFRPQIRRDAITVSEEYNAKWQQVADRLAYLDSEVNRLGKALSDAMSMTVPVSRQTMTDMEVKIQRARERFETIIHYPNDGPAMPDDVTWLQRQAHRGLEYLNEGVKNEETNPGTAGQAGTSPEGEGEAGRNPD